MAYLIIWTILANTSTLNQRCNVHQRCFNVDIWLKISWADIIYRRCFNVGKTTLIELRWFNVDEPMLFQRWNLVQNETWADVCLSTLFQRWNNTDKTTLKQQWQNYVDQRWWPNVVSTLIVSWKWNLSQRMFIRVASRLRKQHLNNFINCFTNVH